MMSRRGFLAGGLAVGLAAGCSSNSDDSGSAGKTSNPASSGASSASGGAGGPSSSGAPAAQPGAPTYVAFDAVQPDLPGNADGVPAAYFNYPAKPVSYATIPVGSGDSITAFVPTNGTGPPRDKSAWWQNLESTLNLKININAVPGIDLTDKQNALIAAGDIPDIMIINPNNVPLGALNKYFMDMTGFLSGDNVKPYKALAAIPTLAWKACTIDGTVFGVPQPRVAIGYALGVSSAAASAAGLGQVSLSKGQDLLDLMKSLTDSANKKWAYGQDPYWMLRIVLEMYGVGTGDKSWVESGGKFTSQYESPQTKDALEVVQTMWRSGYMHPDSASPNASWFPGGIVGMFVSEFTGFASIQIANPDFAMQLVPSPKWDGGGQAVKQLLAPAASGNYAAFKKASATRIKELLRFADYLAAPVGTQEFLTFNYGKAGVSYTLDGTDPVRTAAGQADQYTIQSLAYVTTGALDVFYTPGHKDFVQQQHDYASKVMVNTYTNPAVGLFSETGASAAGKTAEKNIHDLMEDIMFNRKPVSTWDAAVKAWQTAAGNKMRSEYEAAFARAQGH